MQHRWWLGVSIAVGAVLRLIWIDDMEYKGDQIYLFDSCRAVAEGAPLPMLGMPSGAGPLNPGMSLWWHIGFCKLFGVQTPLGLGLMSPLLGVLALLLAWLFVEKNVARVDQPAWYWAIALASVSTLEVSLSRIIWSQTILPCFCIAFLWSFFRRDAVAGAFCWGLIGAILGQIHMSGFFIAAGFVLVGLVVARGKRVRLLPWLIGSLLGALPLVPWLGYLVRSMGEPHASTSTPLKRFLEVAKLAFWAYGLSGPWGLELSYRLGFLSWLRFLSEPTLDGQPTYLIALCHVGLIVIGVSVYVAAFNARRERGWTPSQLWAAMREGHASDTQLAWVAALLAMGVLLTLTTLRLHRHYLIVAFPLWTVFFCALALSCLRKARALLAVMWTLQLAVSIGFLAHVHAQRGAPGEEYGTAYRYQAEPVAKRLATGRNPAIHAR
ncbi:MAG: hypothetical protein ABW321_21180 [Polyangiales bacterium]